MAVGEAAYDRAAILETLKLVAIRDARREVFFARNAFAPPGLAYEGVSDDLQGAVDAVATLMGVDGRAVVDPGLIEIGIQRDETAASRRLRFVREFGDPDGIDEL